VLPDSRERFRPEDDLLEELRQRGEQALAMIREGGYDVVGDLSTLDPPDLDTMRHPSDVTEAELLDAATRTIANMLADVRSLTRERNHLAGRTGHGESVSTTRVSVRKPWSRILRGGGR
jgi:hypothetical protein